MYFWELLGDCVCVNTYCRHNKHVPSTALSNLCWHSPHMLRPGRPESQSGALPPPPAMFSFSILYPLGQMMVPDLLVVRDHVA